LKKLVAPLTFNPETIRVLGEQLVSDPLTALSELVKNAYDADAEKVTIRFPRNRKTIVIEDDGNGMSLNEILKGWLEIGTGLKRRHRLPRSKEKKRVLVGSMGIGRLAAFSLANIIDTQTGQRSGAWRKFALDFRRIERAKKLSSIHVPINTMKDRPAEQGTVITLRSLKWWPSDFQQIKIRLSALSSPRDITDFEIYVEHERKTERIEPEEDLPSSPLVLDSEVDNKGKAVTTLQANAALYEGTLPKTQWTFKHEGEVYPALYGVKLKAFWYALGERPGRRYWRTTLEIQRITKELSGIRVYRNSIRVLPYGETGDDWLELEKHYTALGAMSRNPRPMQIIGWVRISRKENPSLKDVANRQGLMNNPEFNQLKKFCQTAFEFLASARRDIEPLVPRGHELSPEDKPEVEKAVEIIRNAISGNPALKERFSLIEKAISTFFKQSELTALYRDRLTAGLLTSIVMHDIGVPLYSATPSLMTATAESCNNANHKRALQFMAGMVPKINEGYILLAGGMQPDAYRIRSLNVNEVIGATVAQIKVVVQSEKIDVQFEPRESIVARVRRSDLWAIVTNLVANSVQAAGYTHARGRDFPQERKIIVSVQKSKGDLIIECEDNGPGLPGKPEDWIWEAYNTTKPNGSGLGLYIVSDIVAWYAGTKSAQSSTRFSTGALFHIVLAGVVVNA
jgi:signal transduction histidine kinase